MPQRTPLVLSAIWLTSVRSVRNAGAVDCGTPPVTVANWLLSVTPVLRPALPRAAARPTVTDSSLTKVSE